MKGFALCLAAVFLMGNTAFAAEKTEKTAVPVHQTVVWDGTETKMPGYNIDGYTYFSSAGYGKNGVCLCHK